MLTDWPPGPDEQNVSMRMILGFDLDVHFFGLRKHGDGDGGGVDAALRLGGGNALHAVHAALPLELRVDALAFDDGDDFLVSADAGLGERHDFDLPAMLLGEARVHAEDLGGKERGLVAAGAGADFENHVLLVVGILGQQQDLDLVFDGGFARLERGDLFFGHGAQVGVGLGEHGARVGQALLHLLQLAILLHGRLRFREEPWRSSDISRGR